jgi:hypothetical protein
MAAERLMEQVSSEVLEAPLAMAGMEVPADCYAHGDDYDNGRRGGRPRRRVEGRHRPDYRLERRMAAVAVHDGGSALFGRSVSSLPNNISSSTPPPRTNCIKINN